MKIRMRVLARFAAVWFLIPVLGVASLELNHPTGTHGLFLVDKIGGELHFFNPNSFKEISTIVVQKNPHDFVESPDHKTIYVTIYGDGIYGKNPHPGHFIDIVDTQTQKVTGQIDVSPYRAPHGIQIDKSGLIYVSCDLDRKVLIIDPKQRTIIGTIDTEGTGHWIALVPNSNKIFVSNKNVYPFISVLDKVQRKMIGKVPMPNGTQGISSSPDGKMVAAIDFKEPLLVLIDPATDKITDKIPLKDQKIGAFKPCFSPDGRHLVVLNELEGVADIFDTANMHGEQHVIQVGKDPMGVAFSADGKLALVSNHGDGTISVISLREFKVLRSFVGGKGVETLAYF